MVTQELTPVFGILLLYQGAAIGRNAVERRLEQLVVARVKFHHSHFLLVRMITYL